MDADLPELIAGYFKVLSEPLRLSILISLKGGEKSVGQIASVVNSSQPNVSKHLSILLHAGIVVRRKDKNACCYSIADNCIWQVCDIACRP